MRFCAAASLLSDLVQYDYDYAETTDGRYDRRPYGQYLPTQFALPISSTATLVGSTVAVAVATALAATFSGASSPVSVGFPATT